MKKSLCLATIAGAFIFAATAHAQLIFTGTYALTGPQDVTNPGGVAAVGTSFDGLQGLPSGDYGIIKPTETIGDTTFNDSGDVNDGYIAITNVGGGSDGGFNSSSAAYNSILAGVVYTYGTNFAYITIGSTAHPLTIGQEYQVQLFDAAGANDSAIFSDGSASDNSIALTGDDYALGTFVATGDTETISFTPTEATNNAGVLSAIDVRVIPEPSTYALIGLGMAGLLVVGRFIRRPRTA